MKKIETTKAPAAIGPYVQGNIVNGLLFSSGQLPINPETGQIDTNTIEGQAQQSMDNVRALLHAINGTFDHVVKTTCYLSDMENFAAFNEVYASYFKEILPARSCFEVARLPKDALVEIEIIAEVPK